MKSRLKEKYSQHQSTEAKLWISISIILIGSGCILFAFAPMRLFPSAIRLCIGFASGILIIGGLIIIKLTFFPSKRKRGTGQASKTK